MLLSETETKAICDRLLALTKADDANVAVVSEDFSHLRFAANGFTTSGRREDASASVTVWIDKKQGAATASKRRPRHGLYGAIWKQSHDRGITSNAKTGSGADLLFFLLTFVAGKRLQLLFLVRVLFSLPWTNHREVCVLIG